ncbi:hypothetical protein HF086_015441 [Spodoptera exigua]|uniref:GOST seven transmembrane domain-containing protein n=1 Tax=Spodoptera exigua TaxID=7107 RepID=A0A922MWI5_SPOEX|nr:hypothetical protein HF086_015441 [Spodoptera exigua]
MVKTRKKWKTVVFEQPLTDHCPILLSIDCAALSTNVSNSKKVVLNYEGINSLLLKETWNDIYLAGDANIAAELFTKKLLEIININKYFIDVRKKYRPLKPWITRGVVKSIVKRDKLHKQVKKSDSKESARKHYLTYRNTCNKIIKDLKKQYYQEQLVKYNKNIRETWKIVKDVCSISSKKGDPQVLLNIICNSPIDSLNVVNTHFASVGGILANNIMSKLNISEHELALKAKLNSTPLHSMAFLPTDPVEKSARHTLLTVESEGIYVLKMTVSSNKQFKATASIEMAAPSGYLSAAIWPLLPFFGVMCGVYIVLCFGWLLVCSLQWRDLLRIQYWIGGVALLGLIESSTYYAVYSAINSSGPRLGPALQRVVGTGVLWGILGGINAWLRLHHKANDSNRDLLLSEVPLSLLDSAICWWVFVSLAHTMRTLQLRRNGKKYGWTRRTGT